MRLLSCGSNSHGQLGQGNLEDSAKFTPVTFSTPHDRVTNLVFGGTHTLALCKGETNSTLFGAGSNARGQLGPGSAGNRLEFQVIGLEALLEGLERGKKSEIEGGVFRIEGIAAAWETSYVLLRSTNGRDDVLLSMGANDWDELGCTVVGDRSAVNVVDFSSLYSSTEVMRIVEIAAGPRHIVVQLEIIVGGQTTRKIVGWGASRHRQLGHLSLPSPRTATLPTLVPFRFDTDSLAHISVGRDHTTILFQTDNSSTLILLGSTKQGQLGSDALEACAVIEGMTAVGVLAGTVECCWTGTYCITKDSTQVVGCGSNSHDQLGRSDLASSSSFLSIPLPPNRRIMKLACGSEHVLVLLEGGEEAEVWGWGWNEHGNLGDGSLVDVANPKVVWSTGRVLNVWGGNATSWLLLDD